MKVLALSLYSLNLMSVLHPVSIVEDSHAVVHRTVDSCDCMKAMEKMTWAYKRSENLLCVFPVMRGNAACVAGRKSCTTHVHLRTLPLDTGKGGGVGRGRLYSGTLDWYLKTTWTIFSPARIFASCPRPSPMRTQAALPPLAPHSNFYINIFEWPQPRHGRRFYVIFLFRLSYRWLWLYCTVVELFLDI